MDRRGAALILSYMVIAVLTVLVTAFVSRSISEGNIARIYTNSAKAFWIAEAGLAQAYSNFVNNVSQPTSPVNYGGGTYSIDTSGFPSVKITGTFGGVNRAVQASFMRIPHPFEDTLACGGNLTLTGLLARVEVYGRTRISGQYSKTLGASGWFEDKQERVSQDYTTIRIPDYNNNGTTDEFSDFVLFGQKAVQEYPSEQVVYIQNDGTVNIWPNRELANKKVIFVEGSSPGKGNVNVLFDTSWREGEDLTIISTGTITYLEPLQFQTNARLSFVSWNDYNEASIFRSEHESVTYSHANANFVDILDWGSTTGNVIVNGNVSLMEVLTYEKYYYSDRAANGDLPPGFKWLPGTSGTPYLRDWQEAGI